MDAGIRLGLVGVHRSHVGRSLEIAGLLDAFELHQDVAAAVATLG